MQGMLAGEMAAKNVGTGAIFGGGLASSLLFTPLIGGGVAYIITSSRDADPSTMQMIILQDESPAYMMGYQDGYSKTLQKKRNWSSAKGTMTAMGIIAGLVILNASQQ